MPPATLSDLRRAFERPPIRHVGPVQRTAAVSAVFDRDLNLLFIRRADRAGDPWSGQLAFPGGGVDPTDADFLDAAIREAREEVGLDLARAELLGSLDDLSPISGLPNILVRPFAFVIDAHPEVVPNAEVAGAHHRPLASLLAGEGRGPMTLDWKGREWTLPRVDFEGVRLWGMTLRIVDDLLHRIDGRGLGLERPAQ